MARNMSMLKAEQAVINPMIEGKRWQLYSTHDTKKEAESRAITVRRVYKKARVMVIPQKAKEIAKRTTLSKYGVYHP